MIGIFSAKSAHPLLDSREAKRIFAALVHHDSLEAVTEATAWLESLPAATGFKLDWRLQCALEIDAAVISHTEHLTQGYLLQGRAGRLGDAELWQLNHDYWRQLAAVYADCVARQRANPKEARIIQSSLPLFHTRMIHAQAQQLKWDQFRYGPISANFWADLGTAYLAAVAAKTGETRLPLYPGKPPTCGEAEYLKALVFHASSMDQLQPLQVELAGRLIAYFLPHFALMREAWPAGMYWVDAAQPLPPMRLTKVPEATPTLRFFSCTHAVAAVTALLAVLRAEQRVPPDIDLGGSFDAAKVIPVVEHLALYWAPTPPTRSHTRRRMNTWLTVVHGFAPAYQRLSGAVAAASEESWLVEDVSLGGLGAQVPVARNNRIRIGALIGMQPGGGENWLIGIVRRYARSAPDHAAVGIETLSKNPRAVLADARGLPTECLLLDNLETGARVRMALLPEALEDNMALVFDLDGKRVRLHPQETLETGVDFVIASFLVQSLS